MCVRFNGAVSDDQDIPGGGPQGGLLTVLLFDLQVNFAGVPSLHQIKMLELNLHVMKQLLAEQAQTILSELKNLKWKSSYNHMPSDLPNCKTSMSYSGNKLVNC